MNLKDLRFEIKDAGISGADGELTISELSGILSGVIHNAILPEDCKTILKVTAKDGQSKDIEVSWKSTKLTQITVSGLQDIDGETWSMFNGGYAVTTQTTNHIQGMMFIGEEDWDGVMVPKYYIVDLNYYENTNQTVIAFSRVYGDLENSPGHIISAYKSGNVLNNSNIEFTLKFNNDDKYTHNFNVKLQ
jgi:hypothetical protein